MSPPRLWLMASAGFKPPRREGRQLPAALRDERPPRREFHEALTDTDDFEDLPGKWQTAIFIAEQSRPKLRVISGD